MKKKTVVDKGKKASKYLWNYARMTGLLPDFDKKKENKRKEKE